MDNSIDMSVMGGLKMRCKAIVLCILCLSGVMSGQGDKGPNLHELLDKSEKSLSWSESFSLQLGVDARSTQNGLFAGYTARKYTYRKDRGRVEWQGEVTAYDKNGNRGENSYLERVSTTEIGLVTVSHQPGKRPGNALAFFEPQAQVEDLLGSTYKGGPLIGKAYLLNGKTVIGALQETETLSLSDAPEEIAGAICYRVSGKTPYGNISVWIAPSKEYAPLKWSINRDQKRNSGDSSALEVWRQTYGINKWLATYEVQETKGGSDSGIPHRATYTVETKKEGPKQNMTLTTQFEYKIGEIDTNPDFKSIEAFTVDLPDGTPIQVWERPAIRYIWRDGKVVAQLREW